MKITRCVENSPRKNVKSFPLYCLFFMLNKWKQETNRRRRQWNSVRSMCSRVKTTGAIVKNSNNNNNGKKGEQKSLKKGRERETGSVKKKNIAICALFIGWWPTCLCLLAYCENAHKKYIHREKQKQVLCTFSEVVAVSNTNTNLVSSNFYRFRLFFSVWTFNCSTDSI